MPTCTKYINLSFGYIFIPVLEGKVEAAYQTILHIAKDKNFKGLKMAIIWKLVETCIIPIITYGAESRTTTHKESQKICNELRG